MIYKYFIKNVPISIMRHQKCYFCENMAGGKINIRREFDFGNITSLQHWFPSHMSKGLSRMRAMLQKVDCVIEVHDARIPLSGRNPILKEAFGAKPYVTVLNKADLIKGTEEQIDAIYGIYRQEGAQEVLFADCKPIKTVHKSVKTIIPSCVKLIKSSRHLKLSSTADYHVMVVGIPNVGKSSLINAIRKQSLNRKSATSVGYSPGHTRAVMSRIQVYDNPKIWLMDTPGIFQPKIKDFHVGMKLAICNTIRSDLFGSELVVDYLLYCLNQKKEFAYTRHFNLPQPCDHVKTVLLHIARTRNLFCKHSILTGTGKKVVEIPDLKTAAEAFLAAYLQGKLGKFILDDVL